MIRRRLIPIIFFILLVSCLPKIPTNTGIQGQVLIGPTCPVEQIDNPCPDMAYQATLIVLDSDGRQVTRFTTDAEGRFQVSLAPGDYILRPETPKDQPLPIAVEQVFRVVEGQYTQLKVIYDSGIR